MFAVMSAGEVRIARNLLQNRVQLSGSCRDPLQIYLVQHKPRIYLIIFVQACPPDTKSHRKHGDAKSSKRRPESNRFTSTVQAPLGSRQSIAIISFYASLPSRFTCRAANAR